MIPRDRRVVELFEDQARNIAAAAARPRELTGDFGTAPAKGMAQRLPGR